MSEELEEYFKLLNELYSMVKWNFSGCEREILEDKIDEILNWSKYFIERRVDEE